MDAILQKEKEDKAMKDKTIMGIIGLICLTVIVCVALLMGINGVLVGSICTIIGTIVGYAFGVKLSPKEETKDG